MELTTSLDMPALTGSPLLLFFAAAIPLTVIGGVWSYHRARFSRDSRERWFVSLVFSVLWFLYLVLHFHYFPTGVDDSFISFRFSENIADGKGLVYNDGEPIEGFSNPLWVMLLAVGAKLGINSSNAEYLMPLTAKLIGILFSLLLFPMLFAWAAPRNSSRESYLAALVGLGFLLATSANIYWSVSGLETSLHSFMVFLAAILWLQKRTGMLTAAMLLLVVSRPEGALLAAVILGVWMWEDYKDTNKISTAAIQAAVLFLLLEIGMTIFRLAYFGQALPNTFYAKATGDSLFQLRHGLQYLGAGLLATGGWIWAVILFPERAFFQKYTLPIALIFAQSFFIFWVGGDWMAGFRFITPLIPLGAILIAARSEHFFRTKRNLAGLTFRTVSITAVLIFLIGLQAFAYDRIINYQQDFFVSGFRKPDLYPLPEHYDAVKNVLRRSEPDDWIATSEAGLIPYLTHRPTIDCAGLIDKEIAAQPGRMHEKSAGKIILRRKPVLILCPFMKIDLKTGELSGLVVFEHELLADPEFHASYHEVYRNSMFVFYQRN